LLDLCGFSCDELDAHSCCKLWGNADIGISCFPLDTRIF
jgi:hypothetical protein